MASDDWMRRRAQRLKIAGGKCEACGSNKKIEVHHLTYARIYNESVEDLMALCYYHHRAAEECVAEGRLSRNGDSVKLRAATLMALASYGQRTNGVQPNNRTQERLLKEAWFVEAVNLDRERFKKVLHQKFDGVAFSSQIIASAIGYYDRRAKFTKRGPRRLSRKAWRRNRKMARAIRLRAMGRV